MTSKTKSISINNNFSYGHSAILFIKLKKTISPIIKVNFYYIVNWEPINASLSNQLAILQAQIIFLINVNNFQVPYHRHYHGTS